MSVTVKFFASLKERFNESTMEIDLPSDSATVSEVWQLVSQDQQLPANVLSAVNQEFARAGDQVREGDEVAFFPPVTGG